MIIFISKIEVETFMEKNLVIDEEVISIVLNHFKEKKFLIFFCIKKLIYCSGKYIEIKDGYIRK